MNIVKLGSGRISVSTKHIERLIAERGELPYLTALKLFTRCQIPAKDIAAICDASADAVTRWMLEGRVPMRMYQNKLVDMARGLQYGIDNGLITETDKSLPIAELRDKILRFARYTEN